MFNIFKSKEKEIELRKEDPKIKASITLTAFETFFSIFTTTKNPLSIVPVYACIRIISQTIAISPLKLYKKTKKGRELQSNDLTKIMNQPYELMTNFNWLQMMMLSLVGRGNAYAIIVRDRNYKVRELIPLTWDKVYIMEDVNTDKFYYQVNYKSKSFSVWPEDILHYKVFSEDGKRGLNPIELHRMSIDSIGSENDYIKAYYDQAVNISGVVEAPGRLDEKAIKNIKDGFTTKYSGVANAGKTAILSDGMKYNQVSLLSPMDSSYIESAKLSRADIGVIFGVPLSLLGDLSQATYSNLSELNRAFYKMTVAPYYTAIAQENNMKLLSEKDKEDQYFEFDPEILLSASKEERYKTHAVAIRNGIQTRNEVRESENLETLDGLDEILQESGVMTMSQADDRFKQSEVPNNENSDNDIASSDSNNDSSARDQNDIEISAINIMMENVKNNNTLAAKEKSDILSNLGRIKGLLTTSFKTSKGEGKI